MMISASQSRFRLLAILFSSAILLISGCGGGGDSAGEGRPAFPTSRGYTTWARTYGGASEDSIRSIQLTDDGNYVVAGQTKSSGAGDYDAWVFKIDQRGNVLWSKTFGGTQEDVARSVRQTLDGGYIVAGYTKSSGAIGQDVFVLKLNAYGEKEWERRIGGAENDWAASAEQLSDGGYIVGASTLSYGSGDYDFWVLRLNEAGSTIWSKTFGGSDWDTVSSAQQTPDGNIIISGFTFSMPYTSGNADIMLLKIDLDGTQKWYKTYGGADNDVSFSLTQTADGAFAVAGYGGTPPDAFIVKTDSSGNTVWSDLYGLPATYDSASWMKQDSLGDYIVAGYAESPIDGSYDAWLFKIASNGTLIWTRNFGGDNGDWAYCVQIAHDGGYIVAGETTSAGAGLHDGWIFKTDSNGGL